MRHPAPATVFCAVLISASLEAFSQAVYIPKGYWKLSQAKDYEEYVRIQGNAGFLCVLDDKSSFRFTIVGDSITTPWDRKDAIVWAPGSGDLVISGEEKGEPYSTRYRMTDSATYYAKCREEEARIPVATQPRPARLTAPAAPRTGRDALGRKQGRDRGRIPKSGLSAR